jgi:hypothetical protein
MPDLFDALSLIVAKNVAEERAGRRDAAAVTEVDSTVRPAERHVRTGRGAGITRPESVRRLRLLGWGR